MEHRVEKIQEVNTQAEHEMEVALQQF